MTATRKTSTTAKVRVTADDKAWAERTFEPAIPMDAEPPEWMTDAGWKSFSADLLRDCRVVRQVLQMSDTQLRAFFKESDNIADDLMMFVEFAQESIEWHEANIEMLRVARARLLTIGERARQGWPLN